MKNQATWGIVSVLAVAGVLGVSLQPGTKFAGENGTAFRMSERQAKAKASETDAAEKKRACDELAQVLEVFLTIHEAPRPESCFVDGRSKSSAKETAKTPVPPGPALDPKFVIATLPDPVHTHLALMFDRMAEVIQQAAQDEGYSYEASWLPWDNKDETYLRLPDEDQASYRKELLEYQPGILVFRHSPSEDTSKQSGEAGSKSPNGPLAPYRGGLIVFVVGEDPTKGIHTEQFTNALAWIDKLKTLNEKNRARTAILGPTFSGSFPSLAKLLSGGESGKYVREVRVSTAHLAIHSGTANSGTAIREFGALMSGSKLSDLKIDFHGFLERDEAGLERYCGFLGNQSYGADLIAIVSEDETVYGGNNHNGGTKDSDGAGPETVCKGAMRLSYPRDISALRAAYQTNSIFNTTAPQQSSDVARGRLPSDLADPEGQDHDTIRSYAGNQTPLSQEAFLLGIVNALRVGHIQYVILRSTNALDQLFLARYLRRAYPDARIVTDGSDRLFERDRSETGIGGTMSLSTYPLLEIEWPGQRLFNSDTSEGTYIAFRLLLHTQALSENASADPTDGCALPPDPGQFDLPPHTIIGSLPALPGNCKPPVPLPDYGMPSWVIPKECVPPASGSNCDAFRRPATWLTVLGRDGFWAIAAMNESTMSSVPDRGRINIEIPLSLKLWLVFLAGFVCFHMWCCWKASFTAKPSFRTHFANPGEWRHTVLVFLGGWFAAMLPLFVGWGCGVLDASSARILYSRAVLGVLLCECAIALGASIANILRREKLRSGSGGAPQCAEGRLDSGRLIALACGGSALGIILFFAGFALPLQWTLMPANRFFTYYRNMHVLSGVSPLVPLLVLTLGMYAWFWHSLHGLALFGADRCRLPAESDLWLEDSTGNTMRILRMFSQEEAAADTERGAKPLASGIVILILGSIPVASFLVIVWAVSRGLPIRSLGAKYYTGIFLGYLVVCFSLMLAEAWQLLRTWTKLRELLMFLDRTPLRRTLAALRGFSWGSVWGMSGNVLDVRYKLLSRQLESLGHTVSALNALPAGKAADAAPEKAVTVENDCIDALKETRTAGAEFAKWYAENYRKCDAENPKLLKIFQLSTARTAATLLVRLLLPEWRTETNSLVLVEARESSDSEEGQDTAPPLSEKQYIRDAEEFVCLPYMGFVQNILGRMRSIVMSILWLFVATAIAISSYPFDPRQGLSGTILVLFILLGAIILYVYAQMHRDATLSHVTNTKPGELGSDFWLKIVSFGIAPLLGLLATVFPGVADFVFSWLQPGLQSIK